MQYVSFFRQQNTASMELSSIGITMTATDHLTVKNSDTSSRGFAKRPSPLPESTDSGISSRRNDRHSHSSFILSTSRKTEPGEVTEEQASDHLRKTIVKLLKLLGVLFFITIFAM